MNDRYLYRAKRTDNGEWVYGSVIYIDDCAYIICDAEIEDYDTVSADLYATEWQRVDPSTICQCTGLNDKNGKLIWENDICDRKEPYPEIVTYTNGDWTLDYSYASGKERRSNYCNLGFYTIERNNSVYVIGNIFDNPELLEQKGRD